MKKFCQILKKDSPSAICLVQNTLKEAKPMFTTDGGWPALSCCRHASTLHHRGFRPNKERANFCDYRIAVCRRLSPGRFSSNLSSDQLHAGSTLTLNDGVKMPRLGLGVYKSSPGTETKQAVRWAIQNKYHMIDTAARYANEHDVGEVIQKENIQRDNFFVVTKVWDDMHGYDETITSLKTSLQHLGLNFVDLFLIHSPVGGKIVDTWKAMIHLMDKGLTRSIGVSNFGIHHLTALAQYSKILPSINQIEVHPFNQERAVVHYCKENNINIMAYSPLTRGQRLDHPVVKHIAEKYRKTAANVLVRWSLQKDLICIPKSVKHHHIEENINVFDFNLEEEDMENLDLLEENFRTGTNRLTEKWMP